MGPITVNFLTHAAVVVSDATRPRIGRYHIFQATVSLNDYPRMVVAVLGEQMCVERYAQELKKTPLTSSNVKIILPLQFQVYFLKS